MGSWGVAAMWKKVPAVASARGQETVEGACAAAAAHLHERRRQVEVRTCEHSRSRQDVCQATSSQALQVESVLAACAH